MKHDTPILVLVLFLSRQDGSLAGPYDQHLRHSTASNLQQDQELAKTGVVFKSPIPLVMSDEIVPSSSASTRKVQQAQQLGQELHTKAGSPKTKAPKSQGKRSGTWPPTELATQPDTPPETADHVGTILTSTVSSSASITTSGTCQNQAYEWILDDDVATLGSDEEIIQRYIAAVYYFCTTGWTNADKSWVDHATNECNWYKVVCDVLNIEITELNLNYEWLTGILPTELGGLTKLELLRLSRNTLSGTIPTEFGKLSLLQSLEMINIGLQGPIPTVLGLLTAMAGSLNLDSNSLTGTIPTEFGDLVSLKSLSLSGNPLSNGIPSHLANMASLEQLSLSDCGLTGTIPAVLYDVDTLGIIILAGNDFTPSPIATELAKLTALSYLDLSYTDLVGTLPPELFTLSNLIVLKLGGNSLSGVIPSTISALSTNLNTLDLSDNGFSGSIPAAMVGALTELVYVDLSDNAFSLSIPTELGQLADLETLYLDTNALTGTVPSEVCDISSVTVSIDCTEVSCPTAGCCQCGP